MRRRRLYYATLAVALIALAVASRRYGEYLPWFVATYAGDTLWALMVYIALGVFWPRSSSHHLAGIALTLAYLTECSQLYQAPWIRSIRDTDLGGLVFGHGFLWTDLVCYTIGIGTGWTAEHIAQQWSSRRITPTPISLQTQGNGDDVQEPN